MSDLPPQPSATDAGATGSPIDELEPEQAVSDVARAVADADADADAADVGRSVTRPAVSDVPPSTPPTVDAGEPVQMVAWDPAGQKFAMVNQAAVEALFAALPKPLKVVGVIGVLRSGKSFLMNALRYFPESPFGRGEQGFKLGASVTPVTKGIWVWAKPLPEGEGSLVLLDTEGLKDPNHPDPVYDAKVFAITIALCKTLIYNVMKYADAGAIDDLGVVAELAKHFAFRNAESRLRPADAAKFFPRLEFLVRDFTLALEDEDGDPITANEWLEKSILAIDGGLEQADAEQARTLIKGSIKSLFTRRGLTTLPAPTGDVQLLQHMERAAEADVVPEFRDGLHAFAAKVLAETEPIRMLAANGTAASTQLDGPAYVTFARGVVVSLNADKICIESAMSSTANAVNARAFHAAAAALEQHMRTVPLPATEADFVRGRADAKRRANDVLRAECVVVAPRHEPTLADLKACETKEAKEALRVEMLNEAAIAAEGRLVSAFYRNHAKPLLEKFQAENRALSDAYWRDYFDGREAKAREFAAGCMRAGGAADFRQHCLSEFGVRQGFDDGAAAADRDNDADDRPMVPVLPSHGLATVRDDLFAALVNRLRELGETVMQADKSITEHEVAQLKAEQEAAQQQRERDDLQRQAELARAEQRAQNEDFTATLRSVKENHAAALEECQAQHATLVRQLRAESAAAAGRRDWQMTELLATLSEQEASTERRLHAMSEKHAQELKEAHEDAAFAARTASYMGPLFALVSDETLKRWQEEARKAKKEQAEAEAEAELKRKIEEEKKRVEEAEAAKKKEDANSDTDAGGKKKKESGCIVA